MATGRPRRGAWALVDLAGIATFVVIGRWNHHHALSPGGLASTAWPFALGLVVAWALVARRGDDATVSAGVVVTVVTVGVAMTARVVAGQGTAVAFCAVALAYLGAWSVGLRVARRALAVR